MIIELPLQNNYIFSLCEIEIIIWQLSIAKLYFSTGLWLEIKIDQTEQVK